MTLKQLQQLEEHGKRVFDVLDKVAKEFQEKTNLKVEVKKDLNLYGSARPCFWITLAEKELFYFRNAITNPRQPSPVFMKIDPEYEKDLLELMEKHKEKLEFAHGVKVNYHTEKEV